MIDMLLFCKYLSYFWHYLQDFQYWYHQISFISLFLFLYASNFMIDMLLFCEISFKFLALFTGFSILVSSNFFHFIVSVSVCE